MSHTPIDPIPTGLRSQPQDVFDAAMAGFMTQLPTTIDEMNTANAEADASAISATASRISATASAAAALVSQTAAAASAATATSAPGTNATSTTSMAVGLGSKSFTIQTGKLFAKGQFISVASTASPDNLMAGNVTDHNSVTGAITATMTNFRGAGTFAAWTVAVSGPPGLTGIINEQKGADIASASTIDLDAATGNYLHITGTATINAMTLAAGVSRECTADGAFTIAHSSSLLIPGSTSIIAAAGDSFTARGEGAGVTRITAYQRGNGAPTGAYPVMYVRDEKATNTGPGSVTANAYNDRTLNTVVLNTISGASLASDQVTLPPGTYEFTAEAPHFGNNQGWLEVYNVTDSTIAGTGPNFSNINSTTVRYPCAATVTIGATKVFRIRQWMSTGATGTLGASFNIAGRSEIYTTVKIEKVR